jgi:hypothetical protein
MLPRLPPRAQHNEACLAAYLEGLPSDQRDTVVRQFIELRSQLQRLDTHRFVAMTDGSVEKLRATKRPEIVLRAMCVVEVFAGIPGA